MSKIEKLLEGVKVDWKQELRKMMSSLSSKADYFLPNRRFLATGAQWGSKKKKESFESLVIIADTSGSVSQKELEQFVSEAMDIMESFKPKETLLTPKVVCTSGNSSFNARIASIVSIPSRRVSS